MSSAKQEVEKLLSNLPEDASFEDIQYHIYVRQKVVQGLIDYQNGNVLTEEEVSERVEKWLGE